MERTYALWQHERSGEVYAVRLDDERVTGACGPVHHAEARAELLPDFHYDDDPDLAEDIRQHEGDYAVTVRLAAAER